MEEGFHYYGTYCAAYLAGYSHEESLEICYAAALAVACLVFIGSDQVIIAIFCIGLLYAACVRFARAVRPTAIVYIQ